MAETAQLEATFLDDVRQILAQPAVIRSKRVRITHSAWQTLFIAGTWNHEFLGLSRTLATLLIGVPLGFLCYWEEARYVRVWTERSQNLTDEAVMKVARKCQRCRKCRAIILPAFWDACRQCRTATRAGRWAMASVVFVFLPLLLLIFSWVGPK